MPTYLVLMRGATPFDAKPIIASENPTLVEGLFRVSDGGGEPEPLTTLDIDQGEQGHLWPFITPGANAVLFVTVTGGTPRNVDDRDGDVGRGVQQQSTEHRGGHVGGVSWSNCVCMPLTNPRIFLFMPP